MAFFKFFFQAALIMYQDGTIVKVYGAALMPLDDSGCTWLILHFENGIPVVLSPDRFHESLTLHRRTFENVFFSKSEQYDIYTEIYVNATQRVVAFRDENNDLWVFDRFEN